MKEFFHSKEGKQKVLYWILEFGLLICMISMFYKSFITIFESSAPEINRAYAQHLDYLIRSKNADGVSLMSGILFYIFAILAVPCGYLAVWLHRIDKWWEIRKLKKKFENEIELLQQTNQRFIEYDQKKVISGINM